MSGTELSGHDVARELRRRVPSAGVAKIQKLLYYCNGWNLAWNDEPLFRERVEAWSQGPVVADVWHDEDKGRQVQPERELTGAQLAVLEYVVERYGSFTGEQLIEMTHKEEPWLQFTNDAGELVSKNPEITPATMREWFKRDDEYLADRLELERLRERRDIYGFDGPAITPTLMAASQRALAGRSRGRLD